MLLGQQAAAGLARGVGLAGRALGQGEGPPGFRSVRGLLDHVAEVPDSLVPPTHLGEHHAAPELGVRIIGPGPQEMLQMEEGPEPQMVLRRGAGLAVVPGGVRPGAFNVTPLFRLGPRDIDKGYGSRLLAPKS
jgi:hypothetical protein